MYDEDVRRAVDRIDWFFDEILTDYPLSIHWTDLPVSKKGVPDEIVSVFRRGYVTYTKWNKLGYYASKNKVCAGFAYPDYPLSFGYGVKGIVDDLFKDDNLAKAYCRIAKLLPDCINTACSLYGMYRDTLAEISAIKAGQLKKPLGWHGRIVKSAQACLNTGRYNTVIRLWKRFTGKSVLRRLGMLWITYEIV